MLAFEGDGVVELGLGDPDGVDEDEVVLDRGVGGDGSEFVGLGDANPSALHLLEEVPGPHHAHEHHALDGLHVGAGGDHVHGHGDPRVVTVAERLEQVLGLVASVVRLVCDLDHGIVAEAELQPGGSHDVVGVGVVLGEDQRLRDVAETVRVVRVGFPVREHGLVGVPEGGEDGADLVLGHDLAVEVLGVIVDVVVDLFLTDRSGLPVPERRHQTSVHRAA